MKSIPYLRVHGTRISCQLAGHHPKFKLLATMSVFEWAYEVDVSQIFGKYDETSPVYKTEIAET